jgi:hypothetical protein
MTYRALTHRKVYFAHVAYERLMRPWWLEAWGKSALLIAESFQSIYTTTDVN